jgi:hypothetical protein
MVPQRKPARLTGVLLAAVLIVSLAGCNGLTKELLGRLGSSSDEAGRLLSRATDPGEVSVLATRLDDVLRDIPNNASLSSSERESIAAASQRAETLKELLRMFGVADEVMSSISTDAVQLVTGALVSRPTGTFASFLNKISEKVLKDTLCTALSSEMSSREQARTPLPETAQAPSASTTYQSLTEALSDAQISLAAAGRFLDLNRLSSGILSKASSYVDTIKKAMSSAAWQNSGAQQAYWRHCLA